MFSVRITTHAHTVLVLRTAFLAALLVCPLSAQEKRALTFTDLMKIREVEHASISEGGDWVAFTAEPDRGDPEVVVRATAGDARYVIPWASHPVISRAGDFVVARVNVSMAEEADAAPEDPPQRGMAILTTATGEVHGVEDVRAFAISEDGRWLVYHRFLERHEDPAEGRGPAAPAEGDREPGSTLVVRELVTGSETEIAHVRSFGLDEAGRRLAYAAADAEHRRDGLYVRDLRAGTEHIVDARPFGHYTQVTWSEGGSALAFIRAEEDEDGEPGAGSLHVWREAQVTDLVGPGQVPEGWVLPAETNSVTWSENGERLFFGWRPLREDERDRTTPAGGDAGFDAYDVDAILADRGVDVWHWRDPYINPEQKVLWSRVKDRVYTAVYHFDSGRVVSLGDPAVPDVSVPDNADLALARSSVPYRLESTWMGSQSDVWIVDLRTGEKTLVAERLGGSGDASLSPDGRFVAYYQNGHYHLYDVETATKRNLTEDLGVPIANEDHDYPRNPPGYGIAGWIEGDRAVLVHDKYDIWRIPTDGDEPWSLTAGEGREHKRIFRILDIDGEGDPIGRRERLVLSSYHDLNKSYGFYRARADRSGVEKLLEEHRRFRFVAKADDADAVLFTREDYDEFPDLWVASPDFSGARRITDVNPQLAEFAWGSSELVDWESLDGRTLQGVVIKPGNYEPGRRYPVLVYFYRFFSQRLHDFNDPSINHRPSFPVYASDGYVVFLPDVRFEVGRPGFSSMKSVVPGVQHLIDIGLADPDAVALHGHSWSGYQTAFMVTQTNIFKTAIAGAPVANMTSAYSGIRLGSGRARQFQYEKTQSRLSGSLWEARDEYIDNSPVFFADRVQTPLLILHGDVDDAVPWEQSIELYLALRRLGKETVFLQYNDEPHHPQTYANKLDWAMKMKEWVDHYVKGAPAPDWISEGVPHRGR